MAFTVTSGKNNVSEVCESLTAAIQTACSLLKRGTAVHQITGSDGFVMEQRDVEVEFARRSATPLMGNCNRWVSIVRGPCNILCNVAVEPSRAG